MTVNSPSGGWKVMLRWLSNASTLTVSWKLQSSSTIMPYPGAAQPRQCTDTVVSIARSPPPLAAPELQ